MQIIRHTSEFGLDELSFQPFTIDCLLTNQQQS